MNDKLRIAILDMNNGVANQGMRCIREIVAEYDHQLIAEEFDVRQHNQVPDQSFDLYISSGGPGSPLEGGKWKDNFFELIDGLWKHNLGSDQKKYFFFICHSFQMACEHFELGTLAPRKKTSFGVYPIHKTKIGKDDSILDGLADPYFAVDSRDWQLIQPNLDVFEEHGAHILSLEKLRDHVAYERAIMAVRFSDEFVGTQFHPEADPDGMQAHFQKEENRNKVIESYGHAKYDDMMEHLEDEDKIALTHQKIIPHFIENAIAKINKQKELALT